MRTAAVFLLALVAMAYVAQTDAAFCRVSSYKLPCPVVQTIKKQLWAACASKVKVTQIGTTVAAAGGCCQIKQQVKDEAAWKSPNGYSKCEKGQPAYATLKAASAACESLQSYSTC